MVLSQVTGNLCDGEGERAYFICDPVLGGEKYLRYFKRLQEQEPRKNGKFDLKTFDPFLISLFAHTKIRSKNSPPSRLYMLLHPAV